MKFITILLLSFLLSASLWAQDAGDGEAPNEDQAKESVNQVFKTSKREIPLETFIESINKIGPEEYRNRKILYDSSITKSTLFKIVNDETVLKDDPLREFKMVEEMLTLNGYSIVPFGDQFLLVVKSSVATTHYIEILEDGKDDSHVSPNMMSAKVINTVHVPSAEIIRALNPFISKQTGNVTFLPLPSTNGVMILAPKSSIDFISNVIRILDVEGDKTKIELLTVQYTAPKDLTAKIKELRSAKPNKADKTPDPVLIPDDRTMQIIVKATQEQIDEVKKLILLLDVETRGPDVNTNIRFYKLKNAKAEEVANTLNNLYNRIQQIEQKAAQQNNTTRAVVTASNRTGSEEVPTIVAEKNINALLIIGADKDEYNYLVEIVEKLDKRRDQVMIVGSIVEMSETKAWDLAIELAAIDASKINESGKVNPYAVTNFNKSAISIDGDKPGRVPNLGGALITGITYGSQEALPFILNATQTDNEVNSIAQPSIMANDNQSASITIERSVPFETSSTGANQVTNTSVDFSKAPITLQIKPTINSPDRVDAEKYVILEVNVNVSTFDFSTISNGGTPGQNSRQAQTIVTVPDKGVVVIGGLSGFSYDRGESRVPILSKIPLLGNLFKSQNRLKNNQNIYIFISPNIMTNFSQAEKYAEDMGIFFDADKTFYSEMKKRIWTNSQLVGSGLSDSDFYPKKLLPADQ